MSPVTECEFVLALVLVVLLKDSCVMDSMLFGMIGILDFDDRPSEFPYADESSLSVDQFITADDMAVCLLASNMNPLIASQYSAPPCLCRRLNGAATVSGGMCMGDAKLVPRCSTYSHVSL